MVALNIFDYPPHAFMELQHEKENVMATQNTFADSSESQPSPVQPPPETSPESPAPKPKRPTPRTTRRVILFLAAAGVAAGALAAVGIAPKVKVADQLAVAAQAATEARKVVSVVTPTKDAATYELRLPGSTAPLQSAVIYARTDGYLKTFHADIGDRVKAGQLLAEIESPETDARLNEARATLARSRAGLALAQQRLDRTTALYEQGAAARSEFDDDTAVYNAAVAAVKSNEAVVSRLETEQSFQKVVAPFDGVVTQRNVDLGSLVTSGSSSNVTPLFRMEQNDVLKVYVDVPQTASPSVKLGQTVKLAFREVPGRVFEGTVVRTAGTVDASTRTLRTEIHLPNDRGELMAGLYTQVQLPVVDPRNPLRVPASAVVIDSAGPQVVVLDSDNTIRRHPIMLGRDFGREIEVIGGLDGAERLVANPRDDLQTGDKVIIREEAMARR